MWMTIYNDKNVRKKISLHFTLHNDKKQQKIMQKVVTHTTFYTFSG